MRHSIKSGGFVKYGNIGLLGGQNKPNRTYGIVRGV
jgi:hypothetical protein